MLFFLQKYYKFLEKTNIYSRKKYIIMEKKITDSEILANICEKLKTKFYTFGAYTDYNGLDVKNLKNPLIEFIEKKKKEG